MSDIQNLDVKTDDFIGYVDLNQQGYGRIFYYRLDEHKLGDNQSEFIEITPEHMIYEVTHQEGSKAAMIFKQDQIEVVSFAETAAVERKFFKENTELLAFAMMSTKKELVSRVVEEISKKQPVPL